MRFMFIYFFICIFAFYKILMKLIQGFIENYTPWKNTIKINYKLQYT
jgi:hypothetical protein